MGIFTGIKTAIQDFINGIAIIFGKPKPGAGDRKLAKWAVIIGESINSQSKHAIRTQIIKSIENDLKKAANKGGKESTDRIVDNALATPEYMHLLHKLGLEEPHIRVMAMEALKNAK